MENMIEKVAISLCKAAEDDWDWSVFYIVDANDTAETGREVYREMAKAAIEAMRDAKPTESMMVAMWSLSYSNTRESFSACWEAMIDAALKDTLND